MQDLAASNGAMRKGFGKIRRKTGDAPTRTGHRVLLASPPSRARAEIASMLAHAGFSPVLAASGAEAAGILSQPGRPDIVVLDWTLDNPGAAALCRLLREDTSSNDYVYILAIQHQDDTTDLLDALNVGADGVMTLPVNAAELAGRLDAAVRVLDVAARLRASQAEAAGALARLQSVQDAIEADLTRARRLQQALIGPSCTRFGDYEVNLLLRPAGHVGGDLVGLMPINARRIAIYAIDVCGSGVTAALMNARLASHLALGGDENLVLRIDEFGLYDARPPVEVATLFNRKVIDEIGLDMYFTMVYADIDLSTGAGRLVQAGHPYPLLQAPDGRVERLGKGGMPIGLLDDATWEEVAFTLPEGGRLFLGSDGITEAAAPGGLLLGDDGLAAILRTNAFLPGAPLLESLCFAVARYTGEAAADDISAVVVDRAAPSAAFGEPR